MWGGLGSALAAPAVAAPGLAQPPLVAPSPLAKEIALEGVAGCPEAAGRVRPGDSVGLASSGEVTSQGGERLGRVPARSGAAAEAGPFRVRTVEHRATQVVGITIQAARPAPCSSA